MSKSREVIEWALKEGKLSVDTETGVILGAKGAPLERSAVNVYYEGGNYKLLAHRVVAFVAFGPEALAPGAVVLHKDGNKSDNRAENLEVLTRAQYAVRNMQEDRKAVITAARRLLKVPGATQASVARELNMCRVTVHEIAHGFRWGALP